MSARILVIDDEANIRTMVRLTLEFASYQVTAAADGSEGLKVYGTGKDFDLVLVDQRMPVMSGLEVLQTILQRNANARVIMITAFGTIDLALEAIQAGAGDFLRKPFTADTLRLSVQTALGKPVEKRIAVPIDLVCREFTRTTINGFAFEVDEDHPTSDEPGREFRFRVRRTSPDAQVVKVFLPPYVMELVKAYIDSDEVPGGERFWQAMAEEALANYLWQHAEIPEGGSLKVTDLSSSLQRWLDATLTVDVNENA